MADPVFITTTDLQRYVPAWANATYNAEAYILVYAARWTAYLCDLTGYDLSTNYASLTAVFKEILGLYVALRTAINICDKDTRGAPIRTAEFFYDSATAQLARLEAQIIKNVNLIKTGA